MQHNIGTGAQSTVMTYPQDLTKEINKHKYTSQKNSRDCTLASGPVHHSLANAAVLEDSGGLHVVPLLAQEGISPVMT